VRPVALAKKTKIEKKRKKR